MDKTAIIIPSRLDAVRLPNKPLELIKNKEMILHVYEAAQKTNTGDVYVATPDQKIIDVVTKNGGKAILTEVNHQTGTDRIYEVFKNHLKSEPDLIINLQGDMPNIDPKAITKAPIPVDIIATLNPLKPFILALTPLVKFLNFVNIWGLIEIPDDNISQMSHLAGFISGLIIAITLKNQGPKPKKYQWEIDEEKEENEIGIKYIYRK